MTQKQRIRLGIAIALLEEAGEIIGEIENEESEKAKEANQTAAECLEDLGLRLGEIISDVNSEFLAS